MIIRSLAVRAVFTLALTAFCVQERASDLTLAEAQTIAVSNPLFLQQYRKRAKSRPTILTGEAGRSQSSLER